uniref:Uncharacterized protein n=1 Tax=Oryza brachyantha TaxID=4533 RepID=J3KVX7_ORYBR
MTCCVALLIFKNWEDTCYAKFVEVPESTEVPERIEVIECIDIEKEYQEHVLDRTRNKCVLDFDEFSVDEKTYVECFQPLSYMHSKILHLVCHLWSLDWKDKIILSAYAASELLGQRNGTACLDKELTTEKMKSVKQMLTFLCGFHVLLYIKGFENRDIFDINRPIHDIEVEEIHNEEKQLVDDSDDKEGKGTGRDAVNDEKSAGSDANKSASGNDEKSAAENETSVESTLPADEDDAGEDDDNALISPPALVSPPGKRVRRKTAPNSSKHDPPKFEVATQLTAKKRAEVYHYVKEYC